MQEQQRSTRIVEDPDGIEVHKKTGDGAIATRSYKDAAELERADPEAFDAYKQGGGAPGWRPR